MGTAPRIRDYPVVAIFKIGMSEYDESVIYMPLAEAQDYFVVDNAASAIEVMVDNPDAINEMKPALLEAAGPGLDIQTWQQRNQAFFSALAVERNVMFLVLTMIILVAALNIISGLYMLVKDKGHDIAILRTMGASSGSVQRVFFMTGAVIGVAGTLAGFLLGLLFASMSKAFATSSLALRHGSLLAGTLLSFAASRDDGAHADGQDRSHVVGAFLRRDALSILARGAARSGRGIALRMMTPQAA